MNVVPIASLTVVAASLATGATVAGLAMSRVRRLRPKLQALAEHPTLAAAQRAPIAAAPLLDVPKTVSEIEKRVERIAAAIAVTAAAIDRLALLSQQTRRAYEEFVAIVRPRRA